LVEDYGPMWIIVSFFMYISLNNSIRAKICHGFIYEQKILPLTFLPSTAG